MREVIETAHKITDLPATVLILGASGTGKELLARLLHRESSRADAPFIAVNVATIPKELVESTLFGHERGAFTGAHKQQLGKSRKERWSRPRVSSSGMVLTVPSTYSLRAPAPSSEAGVLAQAATAP